MNERQKIADGLLKVLGEASSRLAGIEAEARKELDNLRDKYQAQVTHWKSSLAEMEKQLVKLMKAEQAELFDGRDRVDLEHGALLFIVERRVKKARGVLANLKKLKIMDAIKVSESVNWDELEKWPTEKLILVGTERKRTEKFEYELRAGGDPCEIEVQKHFTGQARIKADDGRR